MFVLPEEFSLEFLSHSLRQQVLTAEKSCRPFPRNARNMPVFRDSSSTNRTAENGLLGIRSSTSPVDGYFGQGILPSIGHCFLLLLAASFYALFYFALLSVMTGLLRRPRLGLVALALIMLLLNAQTTTVLDFALTVLFVLVFLAVLARVGLVAAAAFFFILLTLGTSPPLIFDQWYAGRAMIALVAPLTLLFCAFYVSLGAQPVFGSALKEE